MWRQIVVSLINVHIILTLCSILIFLSSILDLLNNNEHFWKYKIAIITDLLKFFSDSWSPYTNIGIKSRPVLTGTLYNRNINLLNKAIINECYHLVGMIRDLLNSVKVYLSYGLLLRRGLSIMNSEEYLLSTVQVNPLLNQTIILRHLLTPIHHYYLDLHHHWVFYKYLYV